MTFVMAFFCCHFSPKYAGGYRRIAVRLQKLHKNSTFFGFADCINERFCRREKHKNSRK